MITDAIVAAQVVVVVVVAAAAVVVVIVVEVIVVVCSKLYVICNSSSFVSFLLTMIWQWQCACASRDWRSLQVTDYCDMYRITTRRTDSSKATTSSTSSSAYCTLLPFVHTQCYQEPQRRDKLSHGYSATVARTAIVQCHLQRLPRT